MRVSVLGVGLIGGSIGLASRRRAKAEVCGYDADERVRAKALELGAIDTQTADVANAVAGADVVFAAAPIGSLAAAAAGADGIIVETHPNPEEAICDGPQALHADGFADYVGALERAATLAGKALSAV